MRHTTTYRYRLKRTAATALSIVTIAYLDEPELITGE
jgi:hypothetical protein